MERSDFLISYETYRDLIERVDHEINYYLSRKNEAIKNNESPDQIMYYQGCIDSLTWLKKDYGWPKRRV